MALITASLVLYNTKPEEITSVLSSILGSAINKVYVIDNSPTDELKSVVEECGKVHAASDRIEYIFGQGNVGYGKANNIGIKKALELGAKYHVVLNPDITFEPETITKLANYMEAHPSVGMILPRVEYPNGELQHLCKLLPTPYDIFARRCLPKSWNRKRNERYEMHFTGYDKIWNCPYFTGCFMFFNTSALKEVGLFDERFFMYYEDCDITRRIHKIKKTVFYPHVKIVHSKVSGHRHSFRLFIIGITSTIQYFNKWGWFFDRDREKTNLEAIHSGEVKE